ncbi:hypothetical protein [Nocardia iowensis]|uniref:GIY-YIG nuclease family protein n=1 Tax=Nocardia iowensis TaxID=204891 RepID=A0ABX8S5D8_NOCIO|nr:hypothetical protein [Nocardia iowensis]QXN95116.1 hypothetical protein KV110_19975 [Nocardia iowensis]
MTATNPPAPFTEPASYGYLYLGMRIDPPQRTPFVGRSASRTDALRRCTTMARRLETRSEVVRVTVYEALLIPPATNHPRFDVLVLVQTTSPETIPAVEADEALMHLDADFVMAARNTRRIGDIDHATSDAFLFNHFTSPETEPALRQWEQIAGWFTHKAGVDHSALLQPTGESPYVFVNHVALPCGPLRFFLRLLQPSFRKSVSKRLSANQIGFAAIVCKPV